MGIGGVFCNPMIKSQSYSGPASLGCDLPKSCSSGNPPFPLGKMGKLKRATVRGMPFLAGLRSGKCLFLRE